MYPTVIGYVDFIISSEYSWYPTMLRDKKKKRDFIHEERRKI